MPRPASSIHRPGDRSGILRAEFPFPSMSVTRKPTCSLSLRVHAQAERVGEVERELVVAEPAELLHQDHAQYLLSGHPFSAALLADLTTIASDEILVHPLRCLGMLVEESADRFDFTRMDVIVERGDESELLRLNATHRRMPLPHPRSSMLGSR